MRITLLTDAIAVCSGKLRVAWLGLRACEDMNRARAGVPEGAEQGAARSPGWPPGQALQRRAAPSGTPALRVGPQGGPTRRCKASPGPNPGCALRLDWALSGAPRGHD